MLAHELSYHRVAAVRGDPLLPPNYQVQDLKGYASHTKGIRKPGRRIKSLTPGQQNAMVAIETQVVQRRSSMMPILNTFSNRRRVGVKRTTSQVTGVKGLKGLTRRIIPASPPRPSVLPPVPPPEQPAGPPPLKKRRLSQDKHLALSGKENSLDVEEPEDVGRRSRRRK